MLFSTLHIEKCKKALKIYVRCCKIIALEGEVWIKKLLYLILMWDVDVDIIESTKYARKSV